MHRYNPQVARESEPSYIRGRSYRQKDYRLYMQEHFCIFFCGFLKEDNLIISIIGIFIMKYIVHST